MRFIARYGGSPSALLSSRHDIGPNPAEIIFSAIEPKELIRFGWNIAQIPGCVFGAVRSHIPLFIPQHTTQTNLRLVPGSLCLFLVHALLLSSFFFLFTFRIVVACASSCMPSSSSSSLRRSTIRMRNFKFIPRSHKFLFNHIAHIFEILEAFS